MKEILTFQAVIVIFFFSCWGVNLIKLIDLDFEPDYKAEVVRVIGLVTPISVVTVWMDIGEENKKEPEK